MSDSDSSRDGRSRRRTRGRSRSSSSSSSDSRYSYKKKSYRHKRSKGHRSRSRDRHGRSRGRHSVRSSRDRDRRRSRSWSRHRSRSRSRDRHSSPEVKKQEPSSEEQLQAKLQRAIRAAQSADDQLRQQGLLSGSVSRTSYQSSVLDEINDSSFTPKAFVSSRTMRELPVIDLTVDTPLASPVVEDPDSIFHTSLKLDPQAKLDKWVKKLFHLRQKAINGEPLT